MVAEKECFKCHETLPLSEFYRHPMMSDGHLGKCKRCTRRDVQENYAARREQYTEYEKGRYRARYERGDFRPREYEKHRARFTVQNALRRGKLKKEPCEKCGATQRIEAHHDDYSKPLAVRWLCKRDHMRLHRIDPERRQA
jgi:ribosomal protein S27AE